MLNRTMTLGEIIDALKRKGQDEEVRFDFVYFRPSGSIHIYRGNYCDLALGYTNEYKPDDKMTVARLLAVLKDAIGKVFIGYKGGEYEMDRSTPVWVAQNNESPGTGIVDVRDGLYVTLVTACFQ